MGSLANSKCKLVKQKQMKSMFQGVDGYVMSPCLGEHMELTKEYTHPHT